MIPIANFKSNIVKIPKQITITFATPPTNVTITPTFYRYNKTFAISYGFDDGYLEQYQLVLPMYNGGTVIHQDGNVPNYPGLSYTDGCGNRVPFKGTFNLNMSTILDVETPTSLMNYAMLQESYVKGIDLVNHSYTHRTVDNGGWSSDQIIRDAQILDEIDRNYTVMKDSTGIKFQNWTSPGNDDYYIPYINDYINRGIIKTTSSGIVAGATRKSGHDMTAEYWITQKGLGLFRDFLTWTEGAVNRMASDFDIIANKLISVGSEHAWFTFAAHRVNYGESVTVPSTTLKYQSFKWLMEGLESRYGTSGNDTMWFTSINDVYEYLICKKDAKISKSIVGSVAKITFDFSSIPQDFRTHSLSLLISSDANISSITYTGFDEQSSLINYKSLGNNTALVNIGYKPDYEKALFSRLKATVAVRTLQVTKSQADLDIAQSLVTALRNGNFKDDLQLKINAVIVIPDSQVMQIDFGRSIAGYVLPFPWNSFSDTTPGFTVGKKLSNLSTTTSQVTNIAIEVTAPFAGYDANVSFTNITTGLPYPFEACRDCFSVASNTIGKLRLTNLDVTKKYDFSFYAARGFVGNVSQYTVKGITVTMAHKTNIYNTVQILNVTADTGGTLDIEIRGDGANIGYINVIQLTERK
jgi:hypothetical protein